MEAVIAAVSTDKDALASEGADVLYHFLVLLAAAGVSTDAVGGEAEPPAKAVRALDEKASRQG